MADFVTEITVIISESEMPRMRNKQNPWKNPPEITEQLERLADELIQDVVETSWFIYDCEGPTKEEYNDWLQNGVESPGVDKKYWCF